MAEALGHFRTPNPARYFPRGIYNWHGHGGTDFWSFCGISDSSLVSEETGSTFMLAVESQAATFSPTTTQPMPIVLGCSFISPLALLLCILPTLGNVVILRSACWFLQQTPPAVTLEMLWRLVLWRVKVCGVMWLDSLPLVGRWISVCG